MKLRKSILITVLAIFSAVTMRADEGMWLLPLLQQMNQGRMTELGFEISPDEIYSVNHSSLKDAIVIFGGGCTGEVVSDRGLLLTNHHCGYSSIQMLSSVEHNYLKDGYWAMKLNEELPVKGLEVRFLDSFTDVTKKVNKALKGLTDEEEIDNALAELQAKLAKKAKCDEVFTQGQLTSFYGGNTYYFIVYKVFKDIRFVGAPPSSIGKFGADTDNWMWPRHTCDFSVFRIYADRNNEPAEYSENNRPYTPKQSLKISLKGYQENDPVMIMGHPGSTNRFMTASELKETSEINSIRINMRGIRQEVLMADMQSDPKIMIQYASKYSGSSNGWKKWIGMNETFEKLNVSERRAAEEEAFTDWMNAGGEKRIARYGKALENINNAVSGRHDAYVYMTKIRESVLRIELLNASSVGAAADKILASGKDEDIAEVLSWAEEFYKDYSLPTDKKVAVAMINALKDAMDEKDLPEMYKDIENNFGGDVEAFVEDLFANSVYTSYEKVEEALAKKDAEIFTNDKAYKLNKELAQAHNAKLETYLSYSEEFHQGKKDYIAGTLEMREGEAIYPDANFTMRLTYGSVLPYSPRDAVFYKYYTTLDGVMEKEDPDNWEFVVPAKLKELWKNKDFGDYAMPNGQIPACFLSNLDITGGNSGSPVMNGRGELLGLAFDGNWESMSGDVIFEPDYQRCISVDIRYVLFIMDKFGGAGYLLDEMNIVK